LNLINKFLNISYSIQARLKRESTAVHERTEKDLAYATFFIISVFAFLILAGIYISKKISTSIQNRIETLESLTTTEQTNPGDTKETSELDILSSGIGREVALMMIYIMT